MNDLGPDRAIASYGALAAWGLGLFVAVRYLVGVPTLAGSILYATPFAIPFLIVLLPAVAIAAGLLVASAVYTVRPRTRSLPALLLGAATWTVLALLVDLVVRSRDESILSPRQVEVLLWCWGLAVLWFTGRWFLRARSRA